MSKLQLENASVEGKKMNNLVSELASAQIRTGDNLLKFNNPREGWVFFTERGSDRIAEVELTSVADKEIKSVKLDKGESMRRLNAGEYTVSFKANDVHGKFIIRSIPELMYHRYVPTVSTNHPYGAKYEPSQKKLHGRDGMYLYYWDYLSGSILRNFNVVVGITQDEASRKSWLDSGKKIVVQGGLPGMNNWHKYLQYPWDGIIIDEFIPPIKLSEEDKLQGGYSSGMGFKKEVFDHICKMMAPEANKSHGKFYAFLGIPSTIDSMENCRLLMDVLAETDSYCAWEAYIWPDKSCPERGINIDKYLIGRMSELRSAFPDFQQHCVVTLCPSEMWDNNSEVDMKVWMDMQMNAIANNQAFDGLYGVTFWTSTYTKPEMLEWFSSLLRHYCIEGNTSPLSEKYSYGLKPCHLDNYNFSEDLKGWQVTAAAEGSVKVKNVLQFPFKRCYYPQCENLLTMRKETGKTNRIAQEIKGLRAGEQYSLILRVGSPDFEDVKVNYNLHVDIEGVEIVQRETRFLMGDPSNKICWNAIDVVFTAKSDKASLSITDGIPVPDTPTVKEIFLDNLRVQPFYSLKNMR